jgi:Fe-S-cluster-containing dehydrogenase component
MKPVDNERRKFLKKVGITTATAVGLSAGAKAREKKEPKETYYGMLYDSTRCVGCKTCMVACKEANNLPPDYDEERLHDAPIDLSANTRTVIKLYKEGDKHAYIKVQCMHCIDPSCVSVCPVGAMKKDPETGVVYVDDSCLGCRYCQMACPFNIPRFEWNSPIPKKISKCDMCWFTNLKEGKQPACCEVCPNEAIIFGKREELLEEAKRRIKENPGRYVPRVYGESEVGGTGVLYLAGVEFEKLGLPKLPMTAPPQVSEGVQHTVYKGFIAPIVLFSTVLALNVRNRKKREKEEKNE